MHATRAAREEGIVPGGGVALPPRARRDRGRPQEGQGRRALRRRHRRGGARGRRRRQIAENAGHDGGVVVDDIIDTGATKANWGFDARTGEIVDLVKAGIVDPVKVTRLALEYAASVAGLMLMTNTTITSIKEKQASVAGAVS